MQSEVLLRKQKFMLLLPSCIITTAPTRKNEKKKKKCGSFVRFIIFFRTKQKFTVKKAVKKITENLYSTHLKGYKIFY